MNYNMTSKKDKKNFKQFPSLHEYLVLTHDKKGYCNSGHLSQDATSLSSSHLLINMFRHHCLKI